MIPAMMMATMPRTGTPKIRQGSHRVVALCLPGTVAFDLTAPAQAFRLAHAADYTPHYGFTTCSRPSSFLNFNELATPFASRMM